MFLFIDIFSLLTVEEGKKRLNLVDNIMYNLRLISLAQPIDRLARNASAYLSATPPAVLYSSLFRAISTTAPLTTSIHM